MLTAMEEGLKEKDPMSPNFLRSSPVEIGRLSRMCCDLAHFVQGMCMHNPMTEGYTEKTEKRMEIQTMNKWCGIVDLYESEYEGRQAGAQMLLGLINGEGGDIEQNARSIMTFLDVKKDKPVFPNDIISDLCGIITHLARIETALAAAKERDGACGLFVPEQFGFGSGATVLTKMTGIEQALRTLRRIVDIMAQAILRRPDPTQGQGYLAGNVKRVLLQTPTQNDDGDNCYVKVNDSRGCTGQGSRHLICNDVNCLHSVVTENSVFEKQGNALYNHASGKFLSDNHSSDSDVTTQGTDHDDNGWFIEVELEKDDPTELSRYAYMSIYGTYLTIEPDLTKGQRRKELSGIRWSDWTCWKFNLEGLLEQPDGSLKTDPLREGLSEYDGTAYDRIWFEVDRDSDGIVTEVRQKGGWNHAQLVYHPETPQASLFGVKFWCTKESGSGNIFQGSFTESIPQDVKAPWSGGLGTSLEAGPNEQFLIQEIDPVIDFPYPLQAMSSTCTF